MISFCLYIYPQQNLHYVILRKFVGIFERDENEIACLTSGNAIVFRLFV